MVFNTRTLETPAPPAPEVKNFMGAQGSFTEYLYSQGESDIAAYAALQMYASAMPLYNAVDMRARNYAAVPRRLFDQSKAEYRDSHPLIDLLARPNADMTGAELQYAYASYFDATGNSFLLATGRVERPPLEVTVVPPQNVTFGLGSEKFGMLHVPDTVWLTNTKTGRMNTFTAEEVRDKSGGTTIRYYNTERDLELWHTRQFSPFRNMGRFWGMSRAQPVWLEIQQYLSGNISNLSLLKRGTKLSLAWVNNRGEELTDKQWLRLQSEAQKYSGAHNAGGTPVLDGMDVKEVQAKNRDMEFRDLQRDMIARVSTVYGIPLALMLDTAMTLDNLKTAGLQLWDNALTPLTASLQAELTRFLLPRYPNSESLELRMNEGDIPALRPRVLDNAGTQNALGVNTLNEIRTIIGDEQLETGGDVILVPNTMVPVGEDGHTDDNLTRPVDVKSSRFRHALLQLKSRDGTPRYTRADVDRLERGFAGE